MKFRVEKQNTACYSDDSVCEHPVAGITVRKRLQSLLVNAMGRTAGLKSNSNSLLGTAMGRNVGLKSKNNNNNNNNNKAYQSRAMSQQTTSQ
jgi:hypothetical protein